MENRVYYTQAKTWEKKSFNILSTAAWTGIPLFRIMFSEEEWQKGSSLSSLQEFPFTAISI